MGWSIRLYYRLNDREKRKDYTVYIIKGEEREEKVMMYTSSEANKLLREKTDELNKLLRKESMTSDFTVSLGEDVESLRPEYDYQATQAEIRKVKEEIRRIKHSINVFNTVTVIPEFNMTIDEMLVYLPQLSADKSRLEGMSSVLPKTRKNSCHSYGGTNLVEYVYANYDIAQAEKDYQSVRSELSRAQTALDVVNNSVRFEIDL